MAFVCILKSNTVRTDLFQKGNELVVNIPIGFDDCEPFNYSLLAGIDITPMGYEYFFIVLKINSEDDTEERILDSEIVGNFTTPEDRGKILNLLLNSAERLISFTKVDEFYMATYLPDLSERCLEKYHKLCKIFDAGGFGVTPVDSYHGRLMWWMERRS